MKCFLPVVLAVVGFVPLAAETIPISMPPEGAKHPCVYMTAEEVESVRHLVAGQSWAKTIADDVLKQADSLASEPLVIPHTEGQWTHWYTCPDDGTGLKAESPTRHVCRTCKKVYSGAPYDGVYVTMRHEHWLHGIEKLGFGYALDPKPEYAQRVRDILVEYASFYNDLELHDIYGKKGTAKDRLFGQTLNSGVSLCHVSLGYDMVFDAPEFSDEDHRLIAEKFLRPMVADVRANPRGISNWQTWHNAGVCGVGLVIGDREYVDWSINGKNGLLYQLNEGSVLASGMWYEESPSYHWYAFEALAYQLESCKRAGMDFFRRPIVHGLFAAPVRQLLPDGTFAPLHDSVRQSIDGMRRFYEIGYREYNEPLFAALARPRRHPWALFWGAPDMPASDKLPTMASSNEVSEGLAVLRDDGSDTVALLDYGPGKSAHVQPAKLNFVLYALGDIRFVDPGRLPYGNSMHAKWFRQTIAHNTVAVDEKSQAQAPGMLKSWIAADDMTLVRATCAAAYPGVTLDRTLLLKDHVMLDVFVCTADDERTFDMALHLQGDAEGLEPGGDVAPFGNKDGYGILKEVQTLPGGPLHFSASAPDGRVDIQTFDESDNYHALGYGTSSMQELLPAIIRRQKGTTAIYAAAYQIVGNDADPVTALWDPSAGELSVGNVRLRISANRTEYSIGADGTWETAPEAAAASSAGAKESTGATSSLKIDFGSVDVAEGHVEANSATAYDAGLGHGWIGTPVLHDDVQHKPEALDSDFDRHRDFTWGYEPAEFRIDVPPGVYELAVTSGDLNIGGPETRVEIKGTDAEFPTLKPEVLEYVTGAASFEVAASPLVIRFSSAEGNNWQVNDLELRPVDSVREPAVDSVRVRFFEKARTDGKASDANRQVRVIASNYPMLDALSLEGPSPIADLWAEYLEDLHKHETFERGTTTRGAYLEAKAAVAGRTYSEDAAGGSMPEFGIVDDGVLDRFTPWGVYVAEDESVRSDLLARVSLTKKVAEGYLGDGAAALVDLLRRGAYTSLFLRTPTDGDPVCHAARAAIFEMYAMFGAAKAEKEEIGMFKRAAHLALASISPDSIASAQDAAIVSSCLDTAHQYAAFTEDFPEQPAPEDVSYIVVFKPLAFTLSSAKRPRTVAPDSFAPASIKGQMKRVYRYAIEHPRLAQKHGWEKAAFHIGIMDAALATGDDEYLAEAKRWSEAANYDVFMDRRGAMDADNQACAQVYLDLFLKEGGDEKLASIRSIVDRMATNPPEGRKHWWWCDALFMAPPVLAKLAHATGDAKYSELMDSLWWDAKEFLYNEKEHLFFRDHRYFEARTENGSEVFWGRGNGWVVAGLARILSDMPESDPRRAGYLAVYREMATKLASLQGADGMWRTSLLDAKEFPMPETSCTAFFTYALAWGINNGALERAEFEPVVRRGWHALNQVVFPTGKIGWVQHVAGAPGMVAPDMTREYAPGAFLLAGSEVLKMVGAPN